METEIDQAKNFLLKEAAKIGCYERLAINPDFQTFRKDLIDDKISILLRELEESTDIEKDKMVKEQYKVLRGIQRLFDDTLARKREVNEKITELDRIK
jgi:hypothetical protein